jgi:uncharacterized membrane protein YdjX (TVP38/TMEM64 family)
MTWWRRIGAVGPLATVALLVPPVSGILLLGTLPLLGAWLRGHQEIGLVLYLGAFTLLGGLALLPTYAQSVLGGWAFGFGAGWAVTVAGFVGAALVSYAITRRLSGDRIERLLAERRRWHAVYRQLMHTSFGRSVGLITLLRLPPNAPFAASNVGMGALGVPVVPYALGTALGLAPRAGVAVYAGAGLATLDPSNLRDAGTFAASLGLTFATVLLIGWMATRALRRVESAERRAGGDAAIRLEG